MRFDFRNHFFILGAIHAFYHNPFALDLIITGIVGFVVTGKEHFTALIPSFIGTLLLVLGLLAFNPKLRKHVMHGAAMVAILGFIATISGGLTDLPKVSFRKYERTAQARCINKQTDHQFADASFCGDLRYFLYRS